MQCIYFFHNASEFISKIFSFTLSFILQTYAVAMLEKKKRLYTEKSCPERPMPA